MYLTAHMEFKTHFTRTEFSVTYFTTKYSGENAFLLSIKELSYEIIGIYIHLPCNRLEAETFEEN